MIFYWHCTHVHLLNHTCVLYYVAKQAYTMPSALLASSSFFFFLSLPFSLHGKCATGMAKKEFEGSAIPANMLYQAMKAAMMPNAPPARVSGTFGVPSALRSR